jgi:hypothetical protein
MLRLVYDQEARCPTKKGDWVRFLASEVFLASQEHVLSARSGASEMQGVIVDFSDSGTKPRAFAVVELIGGETIVIPVEKLTVCQPSSTGGPGGYGRSV